jgi:hypothetical protein
VGYCLGWAAGLAGCWSGCWAEMEAVAELGFAGFNSRRVDGLVFWLTAGAGSGQGAGPAIRGGMRAGLGDAGLELGWAGL